MTSRLNATRSSRAEEKYKLTGMADDGRANVEEELRVLVFACGEIAKKRV